MKKSTILTLILSCACCLILDSCKSSNVWDDSDSTMGSYRRPKERALWGSNDSQEVATVDYRSSSSSANSDFIPLEDEDLKQQFSEVIFAQPKESPGEDGSALPGINGFQSPTGTLAQIFKNVYFNTDEYTPKDTESTATIQKIVTYLKTNPNTYVFVTGNCDQRGPEAYNQSLGAKRSNSVRSLLIKQGVSAEQIHTVSYGKEKLADTSNNADAWAKNRRAEFKIFVKR
ncbi:MAG: OmpA family protein [Chlamydiota bacterium]